MVRLKADYVTFSSSGNAGVLDDLSFDFAQAAVPETTSLELLALGLLGFGFKSRRIS